MFVSMAGDTQALRDTSGGLGGEASPIRPDEEADDDGHAPVPEEASAP